MFTPPPLREDCYSTIRKTRSLHELEFQLVPSQLVRPVRRQIGTRIVNLTRMAHQHARRDVVPRQRSHGGVSDPMEARMIMERVLVSRGEYVSIKEMKEAVDGVENTSDYVKGEIARKKAIHNKDMIELIKDEHNAYYQKVLDSSLAYDDLALGGERDLEKLATSTFRGTSISQLQTLQQTYLRAVIPLREKLWKVEATEAEQRRRIQANFPMTVTDFLAIRDKAHQLHICRFLMLEDTTVDKGELTGKRDAIMSKYQWAWRQVTPLCEEYAKNDDFKEDVREIAKSIGPAVDLRSVGKV